MIDDKIITLNDRDFVSTQGEPAEEYKERVACRGLIFDKAGRVALMYAANNFYYKLPGGGVDEGEDLLEALRREVLEETGYEVDGVNYLGFSEETRDFLGVHQISHFYFCQVIGFKGEPTLTESEIEEGFELVWAPSLDEAIELISSVDPKGNLGIMFMMTRDSQALKYFKATKS